MEPMVMPLSGHALTREGALVVLASTALSLLIAAGYVLTGHVRRRWARYRGSRLVDDAPGAVAPPEAAPAPVFWTPPDRVPERRLDATGRPPRGLPPRQR